jgi:hypothetical protein
VEQRYVDQLYSEISTLRLELEPDPTILGARYIQGVTSKCRNYLNRVSLIRIQLNQRKRNLMIQIAGEETTLSIDKSRLLAEDETVRRGSNIADREAISNTILRQQINRIAVMKMDLLDIEIVDKAVKMAHDELIRTSQEIKVQRSLLFSDRSSGAAYGDETPIDGSIPPPAAEINESELENLMTGSVPLVKGPVPDEEDPDLLAALASIDDEESTSEVKLQTPVVIASEPSVTSVVSVGGPSIKIAPAVSEVVQKEELSEFLEGKPAPAKASVKKPKSSDTFHSKLKSEDLDMDFNDILSNL